MAILTEANRTAEFLQSEANGYRSRDVQVFDSTTNWAGAAIPAGQVYAIVGGVAVAFDGNAIDGSEVAAGILFEAVEAGGNVDRTVVVRDAEVKRYKLTADGTNSEVDAALLALGIIVRD
jgi:hypothetical protein